jgi:hypothetical protein
MNYEIKGDELVGDERGIFRHGLFKTFLTRGLFKSIFRPILYQREENIHLEFVNVLNDYVLKQEMISPEYLNQILFWLVIVPKKWFELVFMPDKKGNFLIDIAKKAQHLNGTDCAYLTQGYALWMLEQLLKNSPEMNEKTELTIEDFEYAVELLDGKVSKTLGYLDYFRSKFDLEKMDVDPRDWPIIYVWEICDLLISDQSKLEQVMGDWNKSMRKKRELITYNAVFFSKQKEYFIEHIAS